ncbi:MAG TPA: hypothetical protein VK400_18735 [Pyrinomonadaceae bacterium]|nr:hypothetical protein [Pyrinomonadaceae bacterium]
MTKTILSLLFITLIFAFSGKAQTLAPTPTPMPTPPPLIPEAIPIANPATINRSFNDKTAPEAEARLKKIPDAQQTDADVNIRIELIEYYERKETPAAKTATQEHRLWLVRNRPEKMYYRELGWWTSEEDAKNPDYIALKNEWLRQISLKKTNDKIRLSAAAFLDDLDAPLAEKILREGQRLNPNLYEYSEHLIKLYEIGVEGAISDYESREANGKETEIDAALRRVLAEGEKGLTLISKDEARSNTSEHFDLLVRLTEVALDLNELKKARAFAETVLSGIRNEANEDKSSCCWHDTEKAIYYGSNLMGRVALREGNTAKAKEYLLASVIFDPEAEIELGDIKLDLAAELLLKGEKQVVLDYLARVEKLATDANIKTLRRWQRMVRRNSIPYWEDDSY